jgi:hypothetical protein
MRTRTTWPARSLLAAGLIGALTSVERAAEPDATVLGLRVYAYGFDKAELATSRGVAHDLLVSAGVAGTWRDCGDDACADLTTAPVISVHLLPVRKQADPSHSGDLVSASGGARVVLAYVPRIDEIRRQLQGGAGGRSNPFLATCAPGTSSA